MKLTREELTVVAWVLKTADQSKKVQELETLRNEEVGHFI